MSNFRWTSKFLGNKKCHIVDMKTQAAPTFQRFWMRWGLMHDLANKRWPNVRHREGRSKGFAAAVFTSRESCSPNRLISVQDESKVCRKTCQLHRKNDYLGFDIHRFISHTDADSDPLNPSSGHKKRPCEMQGLL